MSEDKNLLFFKKEKGKIEITIFNTLWIIVDFFKKSVESAYLHPLFRFLDVLSQISVIKFEKLF